MRGLEPPPPEGDSVLSAARLPFRHIRILTEFENIGDQASYCKRNLLKNPENAMAFWVLRGRAR